MSNEKNRLHIIAEPIVIMLKCLNLNAVLKTLFRIFQQPLSPIPP